MTSMNFRFWNLPIASDARGSLCPIEFKDLPFKPKRAYFIFNTKQTRGGHAHLKEKEVFICLKGKFEAKIHDGTSWRTFKMSKPGQALYTDKLVWHEFHKFSPDALLLAISSIPYDGGKGYISDTIKFFKLWQKKS